MHEVRDATRGLNQYQRLQGFSGVFPFDWQLFFSRFQVF
jgi:hypothetical protein